MSENRNFKEDFAALFEKSYLPSNATQEDVKKCWAEINELILPNIPDKLFRFRKCNLDNVISLQEGTISLCTPKSFTDRYDSLIYVDKEGLEKSIQAFISNNGVDALVELYESGEAYRQFAPLFSQERMDKLKAEYSGCSSEQLKEIFSYNIQHVRELINARMKDYINLVRSDKLTKIACFTEDVKSLYMWDLYADGYKGFVLEYDLRKFHEQGCGTCPQILTCPKENKNLSSLYPVIYSEKRYDATNDVVNIIGNEAFQNLNIQCPPPPIDQLFWYKSYLYKDLNAYSHEREWRLIARCMNQKDSDYSNIPDLGCLKAIYYGPDMEKRYKDFLMEVAKAKKLLQYDVVVDSYDSNYELKLQPIE